MSQNNEELLQQAVLDFSLGDSDSALSKLDQILETEENNFDAWLSKAEILCAEKRYEEALKAAGKAEKINGQNLLLMTTFSRIWVQLGDKDKAEHYGAQAKLMGWKQELSKGNPS